jgi:spore coat-associated protein N
MPMGEEHARPSRPRKDRMSRIAILLQWPKATLAALAMSLAAVGLVVGSGADFTSSTANPSNTFSSGTLSHTNSKNNAAILTASGMKPGGTATGSVTITNTGSLPGTFSLAKSNLTNPVLGTGSERLSDQLDLLIRDGATTVYSGKLGAMGTIALDGDTGTAGTQTFGATGSPTSTHTYDFTVTLPSATGNAYQGTSMSVQYDWSATQ